MLPACLAHTPGFESGRGVWRGPRHLPQPACSSCGPRRRRRRVCVYGDGRRAGRGRAECRRRKCAGSLGEHEERVHSALACICITGPSRCRLSERWLLAPADDGDFCPPHQSGNEEDQDPSAKRQPISGRVRQRSCPQPPAIKGQPGARPAKQTRSRSRARVPWRLRHRGGAVRCEPGPRSGGLEWPLINLPAPPCRTRPAWWWLCNPSPH